MIILEVTLRSFSLFIETQERACLGSSLRVWQPSPCGSKAVSLAALCSTPRAPLQLYPWAVLPLPPNPAVSCDQLRSSSRKDPTPMWQLSVGSPPAVLSLSSPCNALQNYMELFSPFLWPGRTGPALHEKKIMKKWKGIHWADWILQITSRSTALFW